MLSKLLVTLAIIAAAALFLKQRSQAALATLPSTLALASFALQPIYFSP